MDTRSKSHTKDAINQLWRDRTTTELYRAGMDSDALDFSLCAKDFQIEVCHKHPEHTPRIIPFSCKKRFCPICEQRESYRKVKRYLLPIQQMCDQNLAGYRLRKLVLTTPYALSRLTAKRYSAIWDDLKRFLELWFFREFQQKGTLSASEQRRQRVNLRAHGIGILSSAEFGERGRKLHFHLLLYSPFMPIAKVVETWREVTNGLCYISHISEVDRSDIVGEVQEVVKYVTKFTQLPPRLVPHLATVLSGNRRFRTYGLLNCIESHEDVEHDSSCETCGAAREMVSLMKYIMRCEAAGVPLEDEIIARGESRWNNFSSELEISRGSLPLFTHKARDDTDEDIK